VSSHSSGAAVVGVGERLVRDLPGSSLDEPCVFSLQSFVGGYSLVCPSLSRAAASAVRHVPGPSGAGLFVRLYLDLGSVEGFFEARRLLVDELERESRCCCEGTEACCSFEDLLVDKIVSNMTVERSPLVVMERRVELFHCMSMGAAAAYDSHYSSPECATGAETMARYQAHVAAQYSRPGTPWYRLIRLYEGAGTGVESSMRHWCEFLESTAARK